jgi:anti-sigma regulatory factor (Ser/Thr protein kinase)
MKLGAIGREERSFDAVPTSARAARDFVVRELRDHGATKAEICDYALVVSELATNFIEHGDGARVTVSVESADPGWWEVSIVGDVSEPPDGVLRPDTWRVAGADAASGRGLGIVRHLMDSILTSATDHQVRIQCRRRRADAPTV